eukprot:2834219-Pyramimonas_sp.AAC.1
MQQLIAPPGNGVDLKSQLRHHGPPNRRDARVVCEYGLEGKCPALGIGLLDSECLFVLRCGPVPMFFLNRVTTRSSFARLVVTPPDITITNG